MKTYAVTEIFGTLQGEGRWSGRRAIFVRLAGCNLWNGLPSHRDQGAGACARWCDTNFAMRDRFTAQQIGERCEALWNGPRGRGPEDSAMVVISGGEPTLQLDSDLVRALHDRGFFVAVETNGTNDTPVLRQVDHVCVSPKKGSVLSVFTAHELKVVLPGGIASEPESQWSDFELEAIAERGVWQYKFVQPQDVSDPSFVGVTHLHQQQHIFRADDLFQEHIEECIRFVMDHPGWRLALQQHKHIGVP